MRFRGASVCRDFAASDVNSYTKVAHDMNASGTSGPLGAIADRFDQIPVAAS
jgi:hypothetical protein